jgi:hypothetical protein
MLSCYGKTNSGELFFFLILFGRGFLKSFGKLKFFKYGVKSSFKISQRNISDSEQSRYLKEDFFHFEVPQPSPTTVLIASELCMGRPWGPIEKSESHGESHEKLQISLFKPNSQRQDAYHLKASLFLH